MIIAGVNIANYLKHNCGVLVKTKKVNGISSWEDLRSVITI